MRAPDPMLARVAAAAHLGHSSDRRAARDALTDLWGEVGDDGDPLHRCAIAHALADVQDDPREELAWDVRALDAADSLTDARIAASGSASSVRGFAPSLHLNLADVHLRLGDEASARTHVALGRACLDALPDDGYRQMIASALDRIDGTIARAS